MSSVSDPNLSEEGRGSAQPTTREIPVVPAGAAVPAATAPPPLPPHPGALAPAPVSPIDQPVVAQGQVSGFDEPHETGPVDFVPGLPGAGPPPPPATAQEPAGATAAAPGPDGRTWPDTLETDAPKKASRVRAPQNGAALLGVGLAVLGLLLLELGLGLRFGDRALWSLVPLWSAFATVAALLTLVGFAPATLGRTTAPGGAAAGAGLRWRIAAGGLVGLAVFWLLVVLPHADTNRGFVLTAALGAFGAALWTGPARSR